MRIPLTAPDTDLTGSQEAGHGRPGGPSGFV
jgi:hypothetical protein